MMLIEKMALKKTAEKRQSRKIEEINKAYKEDNTQKDNKSKTQQKYYNAYRENDTQVDSK